MCGELCRKNLVLISKLSRQIREFSQGLFFSKNVTNSTLKNFFSSPKNREWLIQTKVNGTSKGITHNPFSNDWFKFRRRIFSPDYHACYSIIRQSSRKIKNKMGNQRFVPKLLSVANSESYIAQQSILLLMQTLVRLF